MDNLMDSDFTGQPPSTLQPLLEPALAPSSATPPSMPSPDIKREHDSIDDFEHLDKDPSPAKETEKKVLGDFGDFMGDVRYDTQSFLDLERDKVGVDAPNFSATISPPQPSIVQECDEGNEFADSREELSPAPSEDSFEDSGAPDRSLPPSPAHVPFAASAPPPVAAPVLTPAPAPAPVVVPTPAPVPEPIVKPTPVPVSSPAPVPSPAPIKPPTSAPPPPPHASSKPQPVSSAKSSSVQSVKVGEALQSCLCEYICFKIIQYVVIVASIILSRLI